MNTLEKGVEIVGLIGGADGNTPTKSFQDRNNEHMQTQKKRVYFFTLSFAFLSFLVLLTDMLFKFTTELTKNDELWDFLELLARSKNRTQICSVCPSIPKYCKPSYIKV